MRKAIATFMMLSTPPLVLGLGLLFYMHSPLDPTWKLVELFASYIAMPVWVIGGASLYPDIRNKDGPGTPPGRLFLMHLDPSTTTLRVGYVARQTRDGGIAFRNGFTFKIQTRKGKGRSFL